jgi:hypothetical protein
MRHMRQGARHLRQIIRRHLQDGAAEAGATLGSKGAIAVDQMMRTGLTGISYTPPLGSPWDAVQIAAQAWSARPSHTGSSRSPYEAAPMSARTSRPGSATPLSTVSGTGGSEP